MRLRCCGRGVLLSDQIFISHIMIFFVQLNLCRPGQVKLRILDNLGGTVWQFCRRVFAHVR
jgi:hypothetical protein